MNNVPTLVNTLLKETGIGRILLSFTSVHETLRLLATCKELHALEEDVFSNHKLPAICDMREPWQGPVSNEFKLYYAMVGSMNSRWLEWLDSSGVESLMLPKSVTDEELFILFGGKRFVQLRILDLAFCDDITDASLLEVARGCPYLECLYLDRMNEYKNI